MPPLTCRGEDDPGGSEPCREIWDQSSSCGGGGSAVFSADDANNASLFEYLRSDDNFPLPGIFKRADCVLLSSLF